ncbi:maleylacetate reductase [Cupriavidus sp. TA19]|uniref:maleylacetate reductase n=1 Tax=unclassified Cupriavidus TaxID=2640874 RepID=UPI000E2F692A|nr:MULTISPECIES: maleylacetate reductase [unclassified Cupriavidus]BDB29656.1 maleylacetate reductase [Cupriavidus sp. P-10]GLC91241.1 maleylacetate reductase [Cupriavidus sp. TA19]
MLEFTYESRIPRIVFEPGALRHLRREVELLGTTKALVLSTPDQVRHAEMVAGELGQRCAGIFAKAVMHVPIETARAARDEARRIGADCAIAIGGGSTIGLGKAIALESGLPILAIPTTYSGSEVTPIYGVTEAGIKKTGRDPCVLPQTVLYDPELTTTLPFSLSVTSGINAIAHAAEGLYAQDCNPIMELLAIEGIRALAQGLPKLKDNPGDIEGRGKCLYGAWLCGTVLGNVGMALHHKLCHTLGGTFNLPHAETHTIILPHALAYNAPAVPAVMCRIALAIDAEDAATGLWQLAKSLGAPVALRDIGMKQEDLARAVELAATAAYPNPRPLEVDALRGLLERAYTGQPPLILEE